jgi:hypothetical protein
LSSLAKEPFADLLNTILRSEKVISKTLKAILPEITTLSERFDLVESGLVSRSLNSRADLKSLIPCDDSSNLDHIRNGLTVVDYMITASHEDRHDLAQHHAGVPQAVLEALIALTSAALGDTDQEQSGKGELLTSGITNSAVGLSVISCLRIFANMSNVSPTWSETIQTTNGSLMALARIIVHRETIAIIGVGAMDEKVSETVDSIQEGELLCLVLAIVTSAVLFEDQLASALASLGKLSSSYRFKS